MYTPKGYTTIPAIQNYLLIEITQCFQPQVEEWIAQMERFIETYTGRVFVADTEASERVYDGWAGIEMEIDECVEIEKLEIDGNEISDEHYYLYPANTEGKNRIRLKQGVFTRGNQNISVTAKWGYSTEAPPDIVMATTILVTGIIYNSLSHEGEVQSMSMGRYSVSYKTQEQWADYKGVEKTLNLYKRFSF